MPSPVTELHTTEQHHGRTAERPNPHSGVDARCGSVESRLALSTRVRCSGPVTLRLRLRTGPVRYACLGIACDKWDAQWQYFSGGNLMARSSRGKPRRIASAGLRRMARVPFWFTGAAGVAAAVVLGLFAARLLTGPPDVVEPPRRTALGETTLSAIPPMQPVKEPFDALPVLLDDDLVALCGRTRDIDTSVVVTRVIDGQSLFRRVGRSLRTDEIAAAFAGFREFCIATDELRTTLQVIRRFVRRIGDIEDRVARIATDGCGPRFGVNWSYHVDRVRNGTGLERYDEVVGLIERALSYYEDIARDTCALSAKMNDDLDALDARFRYDRAPATIREALSVLRGAQWPDSNDVCRLFREAAMEGKLNGLEGGPALLSDCSEDGLTIILWPTRIFGLFGLGVVTIAQVQSLRIIDGNYSDSRVFQFQGARRPVSAKSARIVRGYLQWIIDKVCADRLTPSKQVDVGRQVFVRALPGWSSMGASRRQHYRDIFDGLVEAKAAARCGDPDYRTMWTLAEQLIDRSYETDVRRVRERYGREYMRQYGFQSYVGRRLEENIYLRRIYQLEYQLSPREVEDPRGPAALTEMIERLSGEYREDLKDAAEREHEMAMADLNARAQIETAKVQAEQQLEVARVNAEAQRDAARIAQETVLLKLRAEARRKEGFLGQVLSAAAPALGSGLVAGVLDRVLFPSGEDRKNDEGSK